MKTYIKINVLKKSAIMNVPPNIILLLTAVLMITTSCNYFNKKKQEEAINKSEIKKTEKIRELSKLYNAEELSNFDNSLKFSIELQELKGKRVFIKDARLIDVYSKNSLLFAKLFCFGINGFPGETSLTLKLTPAQKDTIMMSEYFQEFYLIIDIDSVLYKKENVLDFKGTLIKSFTSNNF